MKPLVTVLDLMNRPAINGSFIIQHLVPDASLCLFTGDSGTGKTAFLSHSMVALASQRLVAGCLETTLGSGDILYVNAEMSGEKLCAYLSRAAQGLDLTDAERAIAFSKIRLAGPDGFQTLSGPGHGYDLRIIWNALHDHPSIRLVIIDTLRSAFTLNENEAQEVGRLYHELRQLINQKRISVVLSHHHKKRGEFQRRGPERAAGSGLLTGGADVHFATDSGGACRFMRYICLEKTREVSGDVRNGHKWPIKGHLTETESRFTIATETGDRTKPAFRSTDETLARRAFDLWRKPELTAAELKMPRRTRERLIASGILRADKKPGEGNRLFYRLVQPLQVAEAA